MPDRNTNRDLWARREPTLDLGAHTPVVACRPRPTSAAGFSPPIGGAPIMTTIAVFSLLLTLACTPSADPTQSPTAPQRAASPVVAEQGSVARPSATMPDGAQITLELAMTPDELAQGLMYRPSLPEDRGMLLIFTEERLPNIWMMNTLVALDLIYLDPAGTVVDVITDAQPCPGEPCPRFTPKRPAQAVLEVPAGSAQRHGIVEGATLTFADVPDYPVAEEAVR